MGITNRVRFPKRWSRQLRFYFSDDWVRKEIGGIEAKFVTEEYPQWESVMSLFRDEQGVIRQLLSDLEPDDVVWDVGANIGLFTCFVGKKAESVFSFEPNEEIVPVLKQNIAENEVPAEIVSVALGKGGKDKIRTDQRFGEWEMEMDTRSIDDIVGQEVPSPDILKVDVEGFEMSVLEGATATLNECRCVYVETHPQYGVNVDGLVSLIENKSFEITWLRQDLLKASKDESGSK